MIGRGIQWIQMDTISRHRNSLEVWVPHCWILRSLLTKLHFLHKILFSEPKLFNLVCCIFGSIYFCDCIVSLYFFLHWILVTIQLQSVERLTWQKVCSGIVWKTLCRYHNISSVIWFIKKFSIFMINGGPGTTPVTPCVTIANILYMSPRFIGQNWRPSALFLPKLKLSMALKSFSALLHCTAADLVVRTHEHSDPQQHLLLASHPFASSTRLDLIS